MSFCVVDVSGSYFLAECNEESTSIVYKYVDDYFIPFQSMEVSGATGWLPVNVIVYIFS